jgi:hypothetical protein
VVQCVFFLAIAYAQPPLLIVAEEPLQVEIVDGSAQLIYRAEGRQVITLSASTLSSPSLDLVLWLRDPDGRLIGFNDDRNMTYGALLESDPLINTLELPAAGDYPIEVRTFDGLGSGQVLLALTAAPPSLPPEALAALNAGTEQVRLDVPQFNIFDYVVQVYAGQRLSLTARSLDDDFDPILELYDAQFNLVGQNDDYGGGDPLLNPRDSRIVGYEVAETSEMFARVRGFAGVGGSVELTIMREVIPLEMVNEPLRPDIVIEAEVVSGGVFEETISVARGDLISLIVTSEDKLDPRLALLDMTRQPIITAERSSPSDVPVVIERQLMTMSGEYIVQVRGFPETAGAFTLIIRHEARDVPMALPERMVAGGFVRDGTAYRQVLPLRAGDYVTLMARSESFGFDPWLLLLDEDNAALALNDDHGTSIPTLGLLDARIAHYPIFVDGAYQVEVGGYSRTQGAFELLIEVLHRAN